MQNKPKAEREKSILLGLIDLYLKMGKPVGSNTLRDNGFQSLSSATLRNYFVKLEKTGFLIQQHSSGGRIPTPKAYKVYAKSVINDTQVDKQDAKFLKTKLQEETRKIAQHLQEAADLMSELTNCAAFLTFPHFEQDLIIDLKLVGIDHARCLCIIVTDFGMIHTETLYSPKKLSNFSLKRIESYTHFKMTGREKPKLSKDEIKIANQFYQEIVLRHIAGATNFSSTGLYKTGFSKLLSYPEFRDADSLLQGLSLFENTTYMHKLLRCCTKLKVWIGDDLTNETMNCSMIAIPYYIHNVPVGAIALLGPTRIPYQKIFSLSRLFSNLLSKSLTKNAYKYKITYRTPSMNAIGIQRAQAEYLLLEDKGDMSND